MCGVRRSTYEFPASCKLICSFITAIAPKARFTSFQILCNCRSLPHADAHNFRDEPNLLVALSDFRGGELWVQSPEGERMLSVGGKSLSGRLIDLQRGPAYFDPHRVHATMPWRGRRLILVAFTIRNPEKLKREHLEFLESVGFRPPRASEALPDLSSDPAGHFPLQAIGAPLSSSELRARFELPPVKDPPGHLAPSHVRAFGSLRVEPRVVASGSPRVELSRPAEPVVSPPRSLAPQAGLDLPHDGLPKPLLDFLLRLPPGRFVFSDVFADLRSALSSGPGWLDLFSGSRGLARKVARATPWWVLCYDILHGFDEDLLNLEVQREIFFLLAEGAFRGFSAGPVCSSFSAAITPAWRTSEFPEGVPWLTPVQRGKVQSGNEMLSFILNLSAESERLGLLYLIENPLNSWFWKQTAWRSWERDSATWDFLVDYCVFGTAWKKPTRIRSNGQLQGQRLRCSRDHRHLVLRGRDKVNQVSWTKRAEAYPRRLCVLLAQTIAQDCGAFAGFRKLDIVRCAKCSGARFGEALRPGPRPPRQRAPFILAEVPLVLPATAALQKSVWNDFVKWIDWGSGREGSACAIALPVLLVELLCAYGQVLYSGGRPLQHYRQLLALAQRKAPLVRPHIRQAWESQRSIGRRCPKPYSRLCAVSPLLGAGFVGCL